MKGAATITATYIAFNGKFQVLIRPVNAPRITRVVTSEQDGIDLVRHFNRFGMAGVDLGRALAEAKAETRRLYPHCETRCPRFSISVTEESERSVNTWNLNGGA